MVAWLHTILLAVRYIEMPIKKYFICFIARFCAWNTSRPLLGRLLIIVNRLAKLITAVHIE